MGGARHFYEGKELNNLKPNSSLDKFYIKDPSIVSRPVADEYILVPISQSADEVESIYTLNDVAARIWELLDGDHSLVEIRDIIVAEYVVDTAKAQADLQKFLQKLEGIGAVKPV